jgi:hypothetical protein
MGHVNALEGQNCVICAGSSNRFLYAHAPTGIIHGFPCTTKYFVFGLIWMFKFRICLIWFWQTCMYVCVYLGGRGGENSKFLLK